MPAEEHSEVMNHRNIAVTVLALSKWFTRNNSHHLQLLYWQVSVTDDVHILNDYFFSCIKWIKLIYVSVLIFLQLDSEIASTMGL